MKEVSGIEGHVISVGLEGMRGHRVIVEANVRDEKEAEKMLACAPRN